MRCMDIKGPRFPKGFLWGASTSAHQVEGSNHNQWSVWELQVASEQAKTAHKRLHYWLGSWERIKSQAERPDNYISGRGVDHYRRYEEDLELLKKLNLNAFRFGIEWSRLEPEEGQWDLAELEHYRKYIAAIRKRGIEPVLNLWHWTHPVWFEQKGGFEKRKNLYYFKRYVEKIAQELDLTQLQYVLTINEPNNYISFGYGLGSWPPNKKNWLQAVIVYWNLAKAHKIAYKVLKTADSRLQIAAALNLANIQAKRPHNYIDQLATKWMRYFWNWWFANRIRRQQDFIGVNYYFSDYYKGLTRANPDYPKSDLGFYMEPESLYDLLIRTWVRYKKPIIVTENGVADDKDQYRDWWLEETMLAMQKAISEGVDLRGYFHWSLLDNFEWDSGWWPKFGLVAVDRAHGMKRTIRPSAKRWAAWLKDQT